MNKLLEKIVLTWIIVSALLVLFVFIMGFFYHIHIDWLTPIARVAGGITAIGLLIGLFYTIWTGKG